MRILVNALIRYCGPELRRAVLLNRQHPARRVRGIRYVGPEKFILPLTQTLELLEQVSPADYELIQRQVKAIHVLTDPPPCGSLVEWAFLDEEFEFTSASEWLWYAQYLVSVAKYIELRKQGHLIPRWSRARKRIRTEGTSLLFKLTDAKVSAMEQWSRDSYPSHTICDIEYVGPVEYVPQLESTFRELEAIMPAAFQRMANHVRVIFAHPDPEDVWYRDRCAIKIDDLDRASNVDWVHQVSRVAWAGALHASIEVRGGRLDDWSAITSEAIQTFCDVTEKLDRQRIETAARQSRELFPEQECSGYAFVGEPGHASAFMDTLELLKAKDPKGYKQVRKYIHEIYTHPDPPGAGYYTRCVFFEAAWWEPYAANWRAGHLVYMASMARSVKEGKLHSHYDDAFNAANEAERRTMALLECDHATSSDSDDLTGHDLKEHANN